MKKESNKEKCPKNFKLYAALLLGFGCMIMALAMFDSLQKGRAGYGDGQLSDKILTVANVSETREISPAETAWLGIEIQDIDETIAKQIDIRNDYGVLVNKVIQGSPADNSGIKRGDAIVRFNHRGVKDVSFLQNLIAKLSVGERVQVVIVRNGDSKTLYVKIGAVPASNENTESMLLWGMAVSPLTATLAQAFGIPENNEGVVVIQVQPGTRAAIAGLLPGDLIMGVNSMPTPDISNFFTAISSTEEVIFDISRDDENIYLTADEEDKPGYQGKPPGISVM